jgi:hypothetical protein
MTTQTPIKPTTEVNNGQTAIAFNGKDRNAFLFGWTPQAELWNGRLAMLGFVFYLFWDFIGFSFLRDVLHIMH